MVNSHYVPQFILRNFYADDKITYCDLEQKTIQARNARTVFSEKGYYPEGIERDLCEKTEHQFANLFHNKIENARSSLSFTAEELFTIKKFLIASAVRYKAELSVEEKAGIEALGPEFEIDYEMCLNDILACEDMQDVISVVKKAERFLLNDTPEPETDAPEMPNIWLWTEIKDLIGAYLIFARPKCDERFIMPDVGRGVYQGPFAIRKMNATVATLQQVPDPSLAQLMTMLSPRDYSVYPLSKDLAIISMSAFYQIFTKSELHVRVMMPDEYPTLSSVLGFGDSDTILPPRVKGNGRDREYKYEIVRLDSGDICHLNSLMITQASRYIACADLKGIQRSIRSAVQYTNRDLSFMRLNLT
ncbi:MAG: DUF4238 domain-containing protein [Lachnospiraceae bacterium]|nr:DUF4238 domain-containing protein [Lachnospiraceae bacterium]